jgi:alkanesulfonate monooxygenase SsuD/methylene tetrahydromethanopterin reductase-like flavin-dependent oxidoreductase (luciferase family)/GNAT superfamily N-acetyltransferase
VQRPEETEFTLPSGIEIKVRPILPEDREELQAGVAQLSQESSYFRFLRVVTELSSDELDYLTNVDYWNHFAWVAAVKKDDEWLPAGLARYVRSSDGGPIAEAAVTVIDDFQGLGIGSVLLQLLADTAQSQSIETFLAVVAAQNKSMIEIFTGLGARIEYDNSVTNMFVTLPFENARFQDSTLRKALREVAASGAQFGAPSDTRLTRGLRPEPNRRDPRERRLDFKTTLQQMSFRQLAGFWEQAEALGIFGTGWVNDHLYDPSFPDRSDSSHSYDAFTSLAALAASTTTLRLGTLVAGNLFRHPAVVARMAATIDQLSGGRFDLGVGAGWHEREHSDHGIELMRPGKRLDAFKEACVILDGLLSGEIVDFDGDYYQLDQARLVPGPVSGSMPLTIGGSGEKRTLRIVAEHAAHWNYDGGGLDAYQRKLEALRGHCEKVGRDIDDIHKSIQVWVPDDHGELVETIHRSRSEGADGVILYFAHNNLGKLDAVAEALKDADLT